jgi:hypothetical protein
VDAQFVQSRSYGVADRLELPSASATANHKIVGNGRHYADVHEQDILTEFADSEIYDRSAQFLRFQTLPPFLPYASFVQRAWRHHSSVTHHTAVAQEHKKLTCSESHVV